MEDWIDVTVMDIIMILAGHEQCQTANEHTPLKDVIIDRVVRGKDLKNSIETTFNVKLSSVFSDMASHPQFTVGKLIEMVKTLRRGPHK